MISFLEITVMKNMPMQYTEISFFFFFFVKIKIFTGKVLIFAQSIDCGYTMSTQNLFFGSNIRIRGPMVL